MECRYEGYGPGGTAVMVDCLTDNKNRTVAVVRHAFTKFGGNLGADGSVNYLFNQVGQLMFPPGSDEDTVMEAAIDAGAEDVVADDDGSIEVLTAPDNFEAVRDGMPKRSAMPVKALSGGERNRVILAKLFTRAANLLVLDEPTNDLDIETLEVLEKRLCDFTGTLIVVSHDREFLDNVVTSTVVFEADGQAKEYVGGYSDWVRHGHQLAETENILAAEAKKRATAERRKNKNKTKLSYKDQRELDQLPAEIENLESGIATLQCQIAAPEFYSQGNDEVQKTLLELSEVETLLEQRIERWSELESKQDALQSS